MSTEPPIPTAYVCVRTDLPVANQIVQAGHACVAGTAAFAIPSACRLIVLAVADRTALEEAARHCRRRDIRMVAFHEPDPPDARSTEPMGLTAFCTEAVSPNNRKAMRRFRLWG